MLAQAFWQSYSTAHTLESRWGTVGSTDPRSSRVCLNLPGCRLSWPATLARRSRNPAYHMHQTYSLRFHDIFLAIVLDSTPPGIEVKHSGQH
jgi:hypothetical protein